jgi:hypothetical protein
MLLLFCSDQLAPRSPDPAYEAEVTVADQLNMPYALLDFEALVYDGDAARAVRRVPSQAIPTPAIFRGWMLTPAQYSQLYEALADRGVSLVNDPAAYRHCHYLPEWYPLLADLTPKSVWLAVEAALAPEARRAALQPFGNQPLLLKDFVKSRKHEWLEACYIPSALDDPVVERVIRRFVELQGPDLNEGLVFREFVALEPLGQHSKSAMPLTKEFRLFFLDGSLCFATAYWDEGDYQGALPPLDLFLAPAQRVQSRFFTMDVARGVDGRWLVIELGDGQVSGLPENADLLAFYTSIQDRWQ